MMNASMALAPNTLRIGRLLSEKLPQLEFAIWDLSEFMHAFHNVRRNIVFIECDKLALDEVLRSLAGERKLRDYLFYFGERKPKTVNEEWASARSVEEIRDVVVIIARQDLSGTTPLEAPNSSLHVPRIERRIVDLIAYSLRGWLPISVDEAVDVLVWFLRENKLHVAFLQRYATRRYLGWFLDIVLYKLEEKNLVNRTRLDPRYIASGSRFMEAVRKVELL